MCGIVGLISKNKNGFSQKEVDAFTQLLYADQVRGTHGTGVFYNSERGRAKIKILKSIYKSSLFVDTKEYLKVENTLFSSSNFIIGHNRAATKGQINVACTHPFREQHIVLVHNGTLNSHKELNDTSEVDSHAICHSMATKGTTKTLEEIDGAFALVWFDTKERTLNLCRNSQRPLNIIETASCFIICSEMALGEWVASRNSMFPTNKEILSTETIYQFKIDNMTKWEKIDVKYKAPFYNTYRESDNGYWTNGVFYKTNKKWGVVRRGYEVGEEIKFKGGILRGGGASCYLEGFESKYPHMLCSLPVVDYDFHDEAYIKVYGKESELLKMALEKKLKGVVERVLIVGNEKYYIVKNVENYGKTTLVIEHKGDFCDWCGVEMKNKTDKNYICERCLAQSEGYNGMYR